MSTVNHFKFGPLELVQVDPQNKWVEVIHEGVAKKFVPRAFESDRRTTSQIVNDILTAAGIEFQFSASIKSESKYYRLSNGRKIRVSGHENNSSFLCINIECGMKESEIRAILTASGIIAA